MSIPCTAVAQVRPVECIPDSVTLGVPAGKDTLYRQILTESVDIQGLDDRHGYIWQLVL